MRDIACNVGSSLKCVIKKIWKRNNYIRSVPGLLTTWEEPEPELTGDITYLKHEYVSNVSITARQETPHPTYDIIDSAK